jgi:hypothetical protein
MLDNIEIQENIRRDIHEKVRRRTLGSIEDDVDHNIDAEVEVWLDLEVYENLKRVFQASKEEDAQHLDEVPMETLFTKIVMDEYFSELCESLIVRETIDKEQETLD